MTRTQTGRSGEVSIWSSFNVVPRFTQKSMFVTRSLFPLLPYPQFSLPRSRSVGPKVTQPVGRRDDTLKSDQWIVEIRSYRSRHFTSKIVLEYLVDTLRHTCSVQYHQPPRLLPPPTPLLCPTSSWSTARICEWTGPLCVNWLATNVCLRHGEK